MSDHSPLSPTARTTATRERELMQSERALLHAFLGEALVAHVGVVVDDHPVVLPMAYAVDLAGPDDGGSLYLHGSTGAPWLRQAATGATVCVTVTELDGLVLARSAFNHSVNFRTAVVIGAARPVADADERLHALDLIVEHVVPGRSSTLRAHTAKELAATQVLAVPLREASLKTREGAPDDEPEDVAAGVWGGHLPFHRVTTGAVPDEHSPGPVPADVVRRAADFPPR